MGKIKSTGTARWRNHEEDCKGCAYYEQDDNEHNLLDIRGSDEKGHYERPNPRFPGTLIAQLSVVLRKNIRPEAKSLHDLIRGYVSEMVHRDLSLEGISESAITKSVRVALQASAHLREGQIARVLIEKEIDDIFLESETVEDAQERVMEILSKIDLKMRDKLKKYVNFKKSTLMGKKGKNRFIRSALESGLSQFEDGVNFGDAESLD